MPYRAVIFDLDGTLADTLADIAAAANHALARLDRPTLDAARYRELVGRGAEWLMKGALGAERAHLCHRGLQLFHAYYDARGTEHTRPYPGIPELLDALTERGLKFAVLSNKPDPAVQQVLATFFARWHFDAARGQRDGVPLKPDPAAALEIAQGLGVAPQNCLYVGDVDVDMQTARTAGMFGVGVLWGFRDEPELRKSGARAIISLPGQLLDLL